MFERRDRPGVAFLMRGTLITVKPDYDTELANLHFEVQRNQGAR